MCNKCDNNTSSAASPKGDDAAKTRLRYQIAVMQAAADGKEIQRGPGRSSTNPWVDADNPAWDWSMFDYRVKPREPREFFINDYFCNYLGGTQGSAVYLTPEAARRGGGKSSMGVVKVREVIEDEPISSSSCCTCGGK